MDKTAAGRSVTVMTTMRTVPGIGMSASSGYPSASTRNTVSAAFRTSTIPPRSFPESV